MAIGGRAAAENLILEFEIIHFFIVQQNTTIINDSSTLHVQMGLLEVQFYYMFRLVEPSSGNIYRQNFLKLLNCIEPKHVVKSYL
jgi:hypothetical protein